MILRKSDLLCYIHFIHYTSTSHIMFIRKPRPLPLNLNIYGMRVSVYPVYETRIVYSTSWPHTTMPWASCQIRKVAIAWIANYRFSFKSVGGNVPCIPGACSTHNFTYLTRGLWKRRVPTCGHQTFHHHSRMSKQRKAYDLYDKYRSIFYLIWLRKYAMEKP